MFFLWGILHQVSDPVGFTAGFGLPIHAHRHLQELLAGIKPLYIGCLEVGDDSPRIRREWNEVGTSVCHKATLYTSSTIRAHICV